MDFYLNMGQRFLYVEIPWATDYDAAQMRLELWRTRYNGSTEQVWAQGLSDVRSGNRRVLYGAEYEGPFFYKVTVLPETSTLASLAGLLAAAALGRLRRRRS
jgi:MYXO-CTERM domain-containing protein